MTLTERAPIRDAEQDCALLRQSAHLAVGEALDALNECEWVLADDLLGYARAQLRTADGLDAEQYV